MAVKSIRVTCDTKLRIPLDELHAIQGKLKTAPLESYQKFRKLVVKRGINFTLHVWKELVAVKSKSEAKRIASLKKGQAERNTVVKWWIIDGHLRKLMLTTMRDEDGYEVPPLPCVEIEATSFQDAKQQVLAASSQFHKITKDGLYEYANDAGLIFEDLAAFDLPDIDMPEFKMEYYDEPAAAEEEEGGKKSVSFDAYQNAAIKQIILYFAKDDYGTAITKLDELVAKFGVEDYSQVVWRLLREAH